MPIPSAPILLTEDDLLDTYGKDQTAHQTVQQYRQAHKLRNSDSNRSRASIAREVERSPSAVREWLVEGAKPPEVKAIETAKEYDWLPLHGDDSVFEGVNKLLGWVYSGGWINPDTYQPSVTVNHPLHQSIASHVLQPLGNPWRSIREGDTDRTHELRPRDGGAILGRLLHALGAPRGRKAAQPVSLPSYLEQVESYYRRQFARMYLLHRGAPANDDDGTGLTIQESRSVEYFTELHTFFRAVTDGQVSLNKSIPKLYLSGKAVESLAGVSKPPKQGLAFRLAYGEGETLVSKRALANTYRATYRNPWTVVQQYYEGMSLLEAKNKDIPVAQLAREIGVSRSKLRSWKRGGKPYALNGIEKAQELGWVGFRPSGRTFLLLNRLVAWMLAAGYLQESNMHPRFLIRSPVHQQLIDSILSSLEIDYSVQTPGTDAEVHPGSNGAILGRVLYVMGIPPTSSTEQSIISLPVYLGGVSKQVRREFAITYVLNRGHRGDTSTKELILNQPRYPKYYIEELQSFLESVTDGDVSRSGTKLRVTTEAIGSIVSDYDPTAPDRSLASDLEL